jgi:hypothetical protein
VWQHTWAEYVALRQWLLDGSDDGVARRMRVDEKAAPGDDLVAGRVLSYLWHILFAPFEDDGIDLMALNRFACPTAGECYCRLYGRCALKCHGPATCSGQYRVPHNYKLPADWAETHS